VTKVLSDKNKTMEDASFHKKWLAIAIDEAKKGRDEGGIPIGSVLIRRKARATSTSLETDEYEVVGTSLSRSEIA